MNSDSNPEGRRVLQSVLRQMFKTLHRNIIEEISLIFVISAVCLDFVLMMEKILRLSRLLSGVGVSFSDIVKIIVLIQPQLLVLTVPMSFLLALLITYGRMNMDSELVVMRAAGMSMGQISMPAAVVGAAAFIITICMTAYVSPASARKLREIVNATIKSYAPLSLEEGVFYHSFNKNNVTVLIGHKPAPDEMRDIFIYDATASERPRIITAESGRILINKEGVPAFDIRNGDIHIVKDDTFTEINFARYAFTTDIGFDLLAERKKEKSLSELFSEVKRLSGDQRRKFYIELHRRLTLAAINIFLIFLGPALSIHSGRRGRLSGFIYGVSIFGVYYSILIYFERLIRSGNLHHLFAWAPVLMVGLFSVYLYTREARK